MLLPGFLEPGLLRWVQQETARAPFDTFVHHLVASDVKELVMRSPELSARLHFLFNERRLFRAVEHIAGCGDIGCYLGRVYKMVPGMGHRDDWHHDVDGNRLAALSVNLTDGLYEGGVLQIMEWHDKQLVHQVANTGPGDAILFELSLDLRHALTDVTGMMSKVAFAGWFEREPVYADRLARPRS